MPQKDKDFTNGELGLLIEAMKEAQDKAHANFDKTLTRIEVQTTKTNGRVDKLENWRNYIVGAIAILTFLIPIAINAYLKIK